MWWMYLVVFASALAVDLIPIIGPPAWTVMVLLLIKFNLNPWGVLAVGVPGSALGRDPTLRCHTESESISNSSLCSFLACCGVSPFVVVTFSQHLS